MRNALLKFSILFFVLLFSISVFGQQAKRKTSEQIADVNFCYLLKNPDAYKDKTVRVKATYRYGFEWSELYCSNCIGKGQVWVDFTESFSENSKKKYRKKLNENGDGGRTVNVTFVGKFLAQGRYGHMNGYPFNFIVEKVENAEIIYKYSPVFNSLPDEVKPKTYCQNND